MAKAAQAAKGIRCPDRHALKLTRKRLSQMMAGWGASAELRAPWARGRRGGGSWWGKYQTANFTEPVRPS